MAGKNDRLFKVSLVVLAVGWLVSAGGVAYSACAAATACSDDCIAMKQYVFTSVDMTATYTYFWNITQGADKTVVMKGQTAPNGVNVVNVCVHITPDGGNPNTPSPNAWILYPDGKSPCPNDVSNNIYTDYGGGSGNRPLDNGAASLPTKCVAGS